jgi:hypothetical protein
MMPPNSAPVQLDPRVAIARRKEFRRIMRAIQRANAPGKEGRIEAAAAKRDRRNAKRARDAGYTKSASLV